MRCYDMFWNGQCVGAAQIITEGLYSQIRCRCNMEHPAVYRITMHSQCGDQQLGVCVPEGELFVLNKRIPSKYIGEGKIHFYIISESDDKRIPVHSQDDKIPICLIKKMQFRIIEGLGYLMIS